MQSQALGSRRDFIERFADHWAAGGGSRIEGLIAGYLLLDESDGVSAEELATELDISRGSVSTYTRQLVGRGFVRRLRRPGERTHFFAMDSDVWAGFLAAEQTYLRDQQRLAQQMLPLVPEGGRSWERIRNMRDYMAWMVESRLPREWERIKRERDDPAR